MQNHLNLWVQKVFELYVAVFKKKKIFFRGVLHLQLPGCFACHAIDLFLDYMYSAILPLDKKTVNDVYRLAIYFQVCYT